jgi:hypothetical protein
MDDPRAICPQCGKEVVFVKSGARQSCPLCGFESPLSPPVIEARKGATGFAWRPLIRALLIALIVAVALGVLGIAVLYAGCAMIMKGVH